MRRHWARLRVLGLQLLLQDPPLGAQDSAQSPSCWFESVNRAPNRTSAEPVTERVTDLATSTKYQSSKLSLNRWLTPPKLTVFNLWIKAVV